MGFITVANETMCRPIRALTEARGHDTSRHVLACFGGAGGQHACSIARSLGMSSVFIHRWGENNNFSQFMQKEESTCHSSPQPPFWSMSTFYWVPEVILNCYPFASLIFFICSCKTLTRLVFTLSSHWLFVEFFSLIWLAVFIPLGLVLKAPSFTFWHSTLYWVRITQI